MADECVFCEIIAGRSPAKIAASWPDAVAFEPLNPVTKGHLLVVPIRHVPYAWSYPAVAAATMRRAAQLAVPPCNIITSAGPEATQTVPHLHLHVVPRRADDGLHLPWTDQPPPPHVAPPADRPRRMVDAGGWEHNENEPRAHSCVHQGCRPVDDSGQRMVGTALGHKGQHAANGVCAYVGCQPESGAQP